MVELSNFGGDCMFVTSRMFHVACCALCSPALRPTRGSGRGAVVDMSGAGVALDALPPLPRDAHAARESAVTAASRVRNDVMVSPYLGLLTAGVGPNIFAASIRCIRSISVV